MAACSTSRARARRPNPPPLPTTTATSPVAPAPHLAAVPHPELTGMALAALTRYASGAPPTTMFDKQLASRRLGRFPGAKAMAGRLVSRFVAKTPAERAAILPGV